MYLSRIRLRPEISATQLPVLLQDRKGYGLHRLFWGLFSDGQNDQQKRRFLFREEIAGEQIQNPGRRKADPIYYVLSEHEPQLDSPLFKVEPKKYAPQIAEGDRLAFRLRVNAVVTREKKRHDIIMDAKNSWLNAQLNDLKLAVTGDKRDRKRRLLDHASDAQIESWRAAIKEGLFEQKLEQSLGRTETLEWALKTSEYSRVLEWWARQGKNRHGFDLALDAEGHPLMEYSAYQKHHLPEKSEKASFSSIDLSGEVIVTDASRFEKLLLDGTGPAKAFGCGLMMVRRIRGR